MCVAESLGTRLPGTVPALLYCVGGWTQPQLFPNMYNVYMYELELSTPLHADVYITAHTAAVVLPRHHW